MTGRSRTPLIWLRCLRCDLRQAWTNGHPIPNGCPACESAQTAETENGEPAFIWSGDADMLNSWGYRQ